MYVTMLHSVNGQKATKMKNQLEMNEQRAKKRFELKNEYEKVGKM